MPITRRQRDTFQGKKIWRSGNEGKGGRGDGAQASDHSLSFLRKHGRITDLVG